MERMRSVHIFNSNIERISLCLSNCQIRNAKKIESVFKKTKSLNRVTSLFKETTATFYILQNANVLSVYSTYFENNFNANEIGCWFAGEDSFVFFLDYLEDSLCRIDVFKKYKFLTPMILEKNIDEIKQYSSFQLDEIGVPFKISEDNLKVKYKSLEEYIKYFSSLLNIPFHLRQFDIIDNPKTKCISFYI